MPIRNGLVAAMFALGAGISHGSQPGEGEFAVMPFDVLTLTPVTFESIWDTSCHGKLSDDEGRALQAEIRRLRFTSRDRRFDWGFVRAAVRLERNTYYLDSSGNVMTPAGEFSTAVSVQSRRRIKARFDDLRSRRCGVSAVSAGASPGSRGAP